MATRNGDRLATNLFPVVICVVYLIIATSTDTIVATPSPSSSASSAVSASASQDKSTIETTTKTTASTSASSSSASASTSSNSAAASQSSSSSSIQSTQVVAAEAAAEAAAAALGGIKNGLEQALSIIPASINLKPAEDVSSTTPAPDKVPITSTTTTPTTSTTSSPNAEQVVVTVHSNGSIAADTVHKHSGKKIDVNDTLHKFDLFIDPVCEQLAKLTDKQVAKLLSQIKQINSLANNHDAIGKCFNEHKFPFDLSSSEVMNRTQLRDFCVARNATSDNYKQWSACSAQSWSANIDKELDQILADRIKGAQAKAKHLSGSEPKLNNVEMSLIDSIVAHLHDEQVKEIASELAHEQKRHEPQHPVSLVGHNKHQPSLVVPGNSGKLFMTSTSPIVEIPPSGSNHHDEIISASPPLRSSQQHHESFLSNSNKQPVLLGGDSPIVLDGATSATSSGGSLNQIQQSNLQSGEPRNQIQQSIQTPVASVSATSEQQQPLVANQVGLKSSDPLSVVGQEQHTTTGQSHSTVSTSNQGQHNTAQQGLTINKSHQEATKATSETVVQQQQPFDQSPVGGGRMNDLLTLAKLQASQQANHQQQTTTSTTTTSSSSHQESSQVSTSASTHTPSLVMPTISPVANFLLNSIDFATRAPSTALPVAAAIPQPIAASGSAPISAAPIVPAQPILAPVQSMPTGFNANIASTGNEQQLASPVMGGGSSLVASGQDAPMATDRTTAGGSAVIPMAPQQPIAAAAEPAAVPVITAQPAAPVVPSNVLPHQPEVVAAPAIAPVASSASAASVSASAASVSAATSQHTEATSSQSSLIPQQRQHEIQAPGVIKQPVAAAPLIEPAVIKNVNTALSVMAKTNSSGIVSMASNSSTNTTLFISGTASTTTTTSAPTTTSPSPSPIAIVLKSDTTPGSTSTTTTTGRPSEANEDAKAIARKKKANGKRKNRGKKGFDEKLAKLKSTFGAGQVHDVIVIGDHKDGDDLLEDYDDHSDHHDDSDHHEGSDDNDEGALILDHLMKSRDSSESHTKIAQRETKKVPAKASAEITTVVEVKDDLADEHKDHEHLLAGLKSGDVVHLDAGEQVTG